MADDHSNPTTSLTKSLPNARDSAKALPSPCIYGDTLDLEEEQMIGSNGRAEGSPSHSSDAGPRPSAGDIMNSGTRNINSTGIDRAAIRNDGLNPETGGQHQNLEKDFEVTFDGDHDPMDPKSIHKARKWLIVSIASMSSTCVTCASSLYTSTYAQIEPEFGCGRIVATLGLSLFVVGLGTFRFLKTFDRNRSKYRSWAPLFDETYAL